MAIISRNTLSFATKREISITHTSFIGVGASFLSSLLTASGTNQGSNQGTDAVAGTLVDQTTAGAIPIPPSRSTEKVYLGGVVHPNGTTTYYGDTYVFDMLWIAGPYTAIGTFNLSGQPAISARLPTSGGVPCYEDVTPILIAHGTTTATQTIDYTYTDENDVSRTPPQYSAGASFGGRCHVLPLMSKGIKKIDSLTIGGGTAWAWSLILARPLFWSWQSVTMSDQVFDSMNNCGLIEVHKEAMLWHCCRGGSNTVKGGWIFKFFVG